MGGLQRTKYVQNTTLGFRNIRQLGNKCHSLRNTTQNRKSGKSTHDNSGILKRRGCKSIGNGGSWELTIYPAYIISFVS